MKYLINIENKYIGKFPFFKTTNDMKKVYKTIISIIC